MMRFCFFLPRCVLRQQRRRRVRVSRLAGQRRQTVGRREPEEEAPPEPDHLHHLPAARAGESLREVPLPGRVQPGGAGAEGQPAGGPSAGRRFSQKHLSVTHRWRLQNMFFTFLKFIYEKNKERKRTFLK